MASRSLKHHRTSLSRLRWRSAERRRQDAARRAAFRPEDRRSDLDHGADLREPRLHDLRHAVRTRRQAHRQAADGRPLRDRADKLTWTFTLRDGLEWHDGKPVTAEDCVASLKRWGARDAMGQKLMSYVAELAAPDAKTIRMTLKEPYGLVLQTLAKPGASVPFMMPKRVAETDPQQADHRIRRLRSLHLQADEWRPGEKAVYLKNPKYKPRGEPASGLAGGKVAKVDRVEWIWIADAQTQVNALINGEIDLVEAPPHDLLPLLAEDKNIELFVFNPAGPAERDPLQRAAQAVRQPEDPPRGRLRAQPEGHARCRDRRLRNGTSSASRCSPAARRCNRPRAGTTSSTPTSPRRARCCRRRATTARRSC